MYNLIIILLIILVVIFSTRYFFLSNEIENMNNQLKLVTDKNTNSKISLSSSKKKLEKLALKINKILEEKQEDKLKYKQEDLKIRQSIANISHDLRTPLTSIMGYMQLMEDNNISNEEKKQYMNIIKNRTESLRILITSFYELSRLEANEYKFDFQLLDLSTMLSELVVSFYNDFVDKGIEPSIDIDNKVSLINGDEKSIKRIISNLIHNILKYGEKFVDISLENCDEYIITKFTNDAPNLKDEDVEQLFDRFFTANRARTGESTGIGLAITQQLVNQMGHEIYADLSEGKLSIIIKWKIHK